MDKGQIARKRWYRREGRRIEARRKEERRGDIQLYGEEAQGKKSKRSPVGSAKRRKGKRREESGKRAKKGRGA